MVRGRGSIHGNLSCQRFLFKEFECTLNMPEMFISFRFAILKLMEIEHIIERR